MKKQNFIVLGVSGSGKSSVAKNLSLYFNLNYVEADKFHTLQNKIKMTRGIALTESDRRTWLAKIIRYLKFRKHTNWVLACSALKASHRKMLLNELENTSLIWLDSSYKNIVKRLDKRKNHFFSSQLIRSQFDDIENPKMSYRIVTNKPLYKVKFEARSKVKKIRKQRSAIFLKFRNNYPWL